MLCYNCFNEIEQSGKCPYCGYLPPASVNTNVLKPGSILNGRYIVGRLLGQGGFGITYIALDNTTKVRVAIKEYFPEGIANRIAGSSTVEKPSGSLADNFDYGKESFLVEAKTLANVKGNDCIVNVYRYFEENGTAYYVMEYIEGIPLDKYISEKGGTISVKEANELLLPLVDALSFVHSKGIVHRDIAPDNIIITPEGKAKLIDFGAARYSTGEKSKSLDVILKHGFAPVEQYTRHSRQGPYTDVYALSATYYYAVTGKILPDAVERVVSDHIEKPSELGVDISPEMENALMGGLGVKIEDRYPTTGDMKDAFDVALAVERSREEAKRRAEEEKRFQA